MTYAPSDDSVQPGHPPRVIRVFVVRLKEGWVLSYPLSAQGRLWSDWADAQADLSLRWAHSHSVGFVMSQLILKRSYIKHNFLIFSSVSSGIKFLGKTKLISKQLIEPGHEKMCLMSYANNKGADQSGPAYPRSLISAFVVRCLDSIISLDSIAEISRL